MKDDRNWNDPEYKAWRLSVYKRDNFTCQYPNCGRKGFSAKIQAHHIKRWADFPELRFLVSNGITLCKRCHNNIEKQEEIFEPIFNNIVANKPNSTPAQRQKTSNASIEAKRILWGTRDEEGEGEVF
jgi:5-methylcytosine-specific restriction endonuclease McrA